jgi:pantoate--beta-alanine ligase
MQILESIEALRTARKTLKGTVGLVPTMGYLHAGHLSLVEAAKTDNELVIATIFVNPSQFAANEDLSNYPRDLPHDFAMLEAAGVYYVFTPTPAMMYPPRFQTWVTVEGVSQGREGAARPEHFRGVATVVSKLFNLIQPDKAYFGQKDAQQVAVIRQMQRDLNFPIEIQVCPIMREEDGLAMSSRNVYLQPHERQAATVLYRALQHVGALYEQGQRHPDLLRHEAEAVIQDEKLAELSYVSLADSRSLEELSTPSEEPILLSLAAKVGKPRLLDNCLLPLSLNTQIGATTYLGAD